MSERPAERGPSGTGHDTAERQVYVEIVAYNGNEVIDRRGPFSERKADKVDDGLNINLNHAAYFTRIVEAPDA